MILYVIYFFNNCVEIVRKPIQLVQITKVFSFSLLSLYLLVPQSLVSDMICPHGHGLTAFVDWPKYVTTPVKITPRIKPNIISFILPPF